MIDIETIFRSVVYIKTTDGVETISQSDCVSNFRSLTKIVTNPPDDKSYQKIYWFIKNFVDDCESDKISVPSYDFLYKNFEMNESSEAIIVLLGRIKLAQPFVGMDYVRILREYVTQQSLLALDGILNTSLRIATHGIDKKIKNKKVKLFGIQDALSYATTEGMRLIQNESHIETEGEILSEKSVGTGKSDYEKIEKNPMDSVGINTWLQRIDESTGGLKSGELMIVTAFTGHCKTTFSINQAYRALYAGWNTAFVSLEMTYKEIRDKMYVLHSCNPAFKTLYPKYAHLVGTIDYNKVRYGQLSSEEKHFYFDIVLEDLRSKQDNLRYGKFFVWQPDKTVTTLSDITLKFMGYQQECKQNGTDLDFGVIDYISLMGADEHERSRDGNETVNNIVKNLKRLCLTFNDGKGIRILSPHQANREGYKKARDPSNEGIYDLTAISNHHEVERSADLVISVYKFEDRDALKLCCLKNRRNKFFKPFDAGINFNTGFIYNTIDSDLSDNIDYSEVVV